MTCIPSAPSCFRRAALPQLSTETTSAYGSPRRSLATVGGGVIARVPDTSPQIAAISLSCRRAPGPPTAAGLSRSDPCRRFVSSYLDLRMREA